MVITPSGKILFVITPSGKILFVIAPAGKILFHLTCVSMTIFQTTVLLPHKTRKTNGTVESTPDIPDLLKENNKQL
jgi:energy-converting hydrogenase Eha subunit H